MRTDKSSTSQSILLAWVLGITTMMIGLAQAAPEGVAVAEPPVYVASYYRRVIDDGPVGYWRFDETAGTTARDSGPNDIEAKYRGVPGSFSLGEEPAIGTGGSVFLDGQDGFVYVADSWTAEAQTLAPRDELSIELWFKPEALSLDNQNHILARWRWYGWQLRTFNGQVWGDLWEETPTGSRQYTSVAGPILTTDQWYHVVLTKDASQIKLFVNGTEVGSAPSQGRAFYEVVDADTDCCGTGGGVGFGRDADVDVWYFQGLLDEVAVYDSALPEADIADHHTVGVAADEALSETHGDQPGGIHVADPIHTGSGSMWLHETDLAAGALAPLPSFERSYNSRDERVGVLGRGWTTTIEPRLNRRGQHLVVYVAPDGRTTRFRANGNGGWERPPGVYAELVELASGFELRFRNGDVHTFDSGGRLAAVSDWAGESMTITRDQKELATALNWSTGQTFALVYDADDRLVSTTSDDGRRVTYGYTDGNLSSVTDPDGATTTYVWDAAGFLQAIVDAAGVEQAFSIYDEAGRVVEQRTPNGDVTFTYDDSTLTTIVTNVETGEAVTYVHDENGRATLVSDPDGNTVAIALDSDGQPIGTVDRLGYQPSATYDVNGNLTSIVDPVRGTSTFQYDAESRMVSTTEPNGATTTLAYEGSERIPSAVTDALGNTTAYDIVDGLIESKADPDAVTSQYSYDTTRRLISTTDGLGNTTTYTYDGAGRQNSIVSPLGNTTSRTFNDAGRVLTSTAADGGVTTYSYDDAGRILATADPVGAITTHTYATSGHLATTTDPAGRTTTYLYDDLGQLSAVTANDGSVTETDYGLLGRVTSMRDPLGRETSYTYDANGNRSEVVAPDGGVTRTEYDAAGRVTALEDPIGRRSIHEYDEFGRLLVVTRPDGTTLSYSYDLLGRRITETTPDGGTTTTEYTSAGRIAALVNPENERMDFGYDPAGRLITTTDANGNSTTFGYDADSRRVSVTTPESLVTTWGYDPVGRVISISEPDGVEIVSSYTLRGELAATQRSGDGVASYEYNLDGTMASATDPLGKTTTFGYDSVRRLVERTDATGATEAWEFNRANELTAEIDRLGQRTEINYDATGRVSAIIDASGRSATYSYNLAGEIDQRVFGDGTAIAYTYDAAGRRASMADPTGTTTYAYDPNGRPTSIAAPDGTLGYTYDLVGRRTGLTYPDGETVAYTYDPAGRLIGLDDPRSGSVGYTLDDDGRVLRTDLPDGAVRRFEYENGRLVTHESHGRVTTLTYDASGRLGALTGAQNHTYTYDEAGQLASAVQDEGTYSYSYGPRGEVTTIDEPARRRVFEHNANGEITAIIDGEGNTGTVLYDAAGRIIEHLDPDGSATIYSYDARGLLETATIQTAGTAPDRCAGLEPTIEGTPGDDVLVGTNADDVIVGLGGDDTIEGGNGTDIICGGPGNDTIADSGNASDIIDGGPGNDYLDGGNGKDDLYGGTGDDILFGGNGKDTIDGGPGIDTIDGGPAKDTCELEVTASSCETALETSEPPTTPVETTIVRRTHDGDANMLGLDITGPDGITDSNVIAWDRAAGINEIVELTANGTSRAIVHGHQREVEAGSSTVLSALGDSLTAGSPNASPFGPHDRDDIGFGYRDELETPTSVHLRYRELSSDLGVFTSRDPLDGVSGATTIANPYHYADNDPINRRDPLGLRPTDASSFAPAIPTLSPPELISDDPVCWGLHGEVTSDDDLINLAEQLGERNATMGDRIGSCVSDGLTDFFKFAVNLVPFGGCATSLHAMFGKDSVSGWDVAGCAIDAAGGAVAGVVVKGAKGARYIRYVDDVPTPGTASSVVRHGPINPGPLADDIAQTFRSGTYNAVTTSRPTTLYRVYSDEARQLRSFWTRTRPTGPTQSIVDSALDPAWGNRATSWVEIRVPAGTTFYEGAAASQGGLVGGGNQVVVNWVDDAWVVASGQF